MMEKKFKEELCKDNVFNVNGQYIITGKGDTWNEAKSEIDELYNAWMFACKLSGQEENEIISRINYAEIQKRIEGTKYYYYFVDDEGVIGEPIIVAFNNEEQKIDFLLLLLYISSKVNDNAKIYIKEFIKTERIQI